MRLLIVFLYIIIKYIIFISFLWEIPEYYFNVFAIPVNNIIAIIILLGSLPVIITSSAGKLWNKVCYFTIIYVMIFLILFLIEILVGRMSVLSGIYCLAVLFLLQLCTLLGYNIRYKAKLYYILLNSTIIFLLGAFSTNNIVLFYFFFEAALIPMFLIIIIWGTREEKSSAAYQFFLYTIIGSFCLLFGIIYLILNKQTVNIYFNQTFQIPSNMQYILFILFFIGFAVKIPIFPFHLWLPKAHVEAPTVGSILLAGILLKLGSYGFIKFNLLLFPNVINFYKPLIFTLATVGVLYTVFTILRQIHLKRIIAYSSISHMNFVSLACFSGEFISLQGGVLLTLAHGLSSSGLFACVGSIYTRMKTMNILYLRALSTIMPVNAIFFLFFMLSNIGFPPTLNFIAELFILTGLIYVNPKIVYIIGLGLILGTVAGLWIYTRIFFGNYVFIKQTNNTPILKFSDINSIEFICLFLLVCLSIILALFGGKIMVLNDFWLSALFFD
jgi:proton-translocating NADH-quinone oxidoreductase chain M